jgi:formate hydrogenlyase subunit 4
MSEFFQYFILGILFVTVFMPILEQITQIILTLLELVKGKLMIPITKINNTINNINEGEPTKSHPIGFAAAFDVVAESEDYDDEDL